MKTTYLAPLAAALGLGAAALIPASALAQPYMGPGESYSQRPTWAEGNEPLAAPNYHGRRNHAGYDSAAGRNPADVGYPTWAEGNEPLTTANNGWNNGWNNGGWGSESGYAYGPAGYDNGYENDYGYGNGYPDQGYVGASYGYGYGDTGFQGGYDRDHAARDRTMNRHNVAMRGHDMDRHGGFADNDRDNSFGNRPNRSNGAARVQYASVGGAMHNSAGAHANGMSMHSAPGGANAGMNGGTMNTGAGASAGASGGAAGGASNH